MIARWTMPRIVPGIILALATATRDAPAGVGPPPRPNVVLCMADDQGYGDVGYYGNPVPHTPHLDAMAASALRLDRFDAAAPVCSPTRGSVLTGRHPNRFGCFRWGYTLRPEEVTVAEALKEAGYSTGHFGKWHLGSMKADGSNAPGTSGFDVWQSTPNFYENDPLMSRNGQVVQAEGESSMVAVEAALGFIRDASEKEKPFLAVVWFGSPHSPHIATPETRAPYDELPKNKQEYYGEITGIDNAMGRLRRELRSMGLAENTIVWYTSDNGPTGIGSSGGLRGRKGTLWEGGLRVPTIIEWPAAIPEPRDSDLPCGTVDILPTLLELTGARLPDSDRPIDGISLVPLIEGRMTARSKPMGVWDYSAPGRPMRSTAILRALRQAQTSGEPLPELPPPPSAPADRLIATFEAGEPLPGHAAWIDGRYKLHRIPGRGNTISYELYDLVADPAESNDLADKKPEVVARMKAALADWQGSVVRSLRGDDYN